MRKLSSILALLALAACGSSNSDGSVASGPLGQEPLMTPAVQKLTSTALDACVAAKAQGVSLATLQSKGFVPFRGGYRAGVANPHIWFDGKSYVWARSKGDACMVFTGPAYPIEVQTLIPLPETSVSRSTRPFEVTIRRRNDGLDVVLE